MLLFYRYPNMYLFFHYKRYAKTKSQRSTQPIIIRINNTFQANWITDETRLNTRKKHFVLEVNYNRRPWARTKIKVECNSELTHFSVVFICTCTIYLNLFLFYFTYFKAFVFYSIVCVYVFSQRDAIHFYVLTS